MKGTVTAQAAARHRLQPSCFTNICNREEQAGPTSSSAPPHPHPHTHNGKLTAASAPGSGTIFLGNLTRRLLPGTGL